MLAPYPRGCLFSSFSNNHAFDGDGKSLQSRDVSECKAITPYEALILRRWSRYLRLLLDLVQYYGYLRLTSSQEAPTILLPSLDQFTIISCTLGDQSDYASNIRSWLACDPGAINIVTIAGKLEKVRALVNTVGDHRIRVDSIEEANYRKQASMAIQKTITPYLIIVDDDVKWSSQTLQYIAVAFSNPAVGGVNTMQEVCPSDGHLTTWESFGALNLVRRNVLHSFVAYFTNGHVLNLSGRTAAYRTGILQLEEFYFAFQNDYWRGHYYIRTGDDNFFTSWIVQRGWKTRFLNDKDALIITTMNVDASYLKQLMRWSRDTARSYLRDCRFAVKQGDASFRVYCLFKVVANYSSDLAIALELGILLIVTTLRGYGVSNSDDSPQL